MRIAWYSNTPWASSGYGVQTKLLAPRLAALGHDVAIIANCGLSGGMLNWGKLPVYPSGFQGSTAELARFQCAHYGADVAISFYDAWTLSPEFFEPARWVPWYPVDREPFPAAVQKKVSKAWASMVCSRFGKKQAQAAGIESDYIPCCVDTKLFCPGDKREARGVLGFDEDAFIVGIVADNKGYPCRKAITQQIQAFAEARQPGWILYLHTCLSNARGGQALMPLINHLGIKPFVRSCDQNQYQMGFPDEYMVNVYRSIDLLSAVTMDEGFGVPIIEAQACGTPVVAGDWTAMPELVAAGLTIPKEEAEQWWNPTGGFQYLPHVGGIAESLTCFYDGLGSQVRMNAVDWVRENYDVDVVVERYWKPALAKLEQRVRDEKTGAAPQEAEKAVANG